MSEHPNQRGKREGSDGSPLKDWWVKYRAWVAGLDRKAKLRYRICQVLAVAAILVMAAALYLRAWIRLPDIPDVPPGPVTGDQTSSGSQSGDASLSDWSYEGAELPEVARSGRRTGCYTFLLAGRDVVSGATDTVILLTYDTQEQKITAISLLRDTMINTSAASKRLNTVFARNQGDRTLSDKERVASGMAALKTEVSRLTGIYPDFYVMVEWEAIGRLVDAIGGVYFDVPPGMDYDDPYQDLHIHQEAGYRLLDGQDAMEVIRFRKNNDESVVMYDSGRTQIQRDFLTAVLKKCLTPEILLKLPALVQIFMDNVDTDLTVGNILAFAQLAVGMDTEQNVNFVSMPFDNVWYNGASMVVARQSELLELLNDGLNPYLDDIKASDLQLMYAKRGGGFGVTNAALADPAVGVVPAAPKPEGPKDPEDPEDPDETGKPGGQPEDPDETGKPGGQPEDPEEPDQSGGTGTEIGVIDPSEIFPDPQDPSGNNTATQPQDMTQAAA